MSDIHIAGPRDLDDLRALAIQTFTETYADHNTPEDMARYLDEFFARSVLEAEMAMDHSCFLLMRRDGEAVGYARLRNGDCGLPLSATPCWEMERFYIHSSGHGKGWAMTLMEACFDEARARKYAGVWLGVWEQNTRAIRFYHKAGFRDEGEKKFVLGQDIQNDRVLVFVL